jgi:hypothetical protein
MLVTGFGATALQRFAERGREVRIPIQSGQGFRFDVGRRSDLMSATIPK